ncbi:5,10-methylenetetrahydromethanopterin reductase [Spinactinospora alkalitolerans]|uniref:5,10-methylenetetrahydromethanopterin reductase n=1 Tax=Spinactinospora alkalitolerans TaxID=687207 RepID=A0A852TTA3_9ACTN|nr:LLM class flavin-dependent oxidoreductase [Spinactinospora alkalitolerans]NYE47158.1 5,10-methylenetetrahydromethanopterin reductase [Spinactinospora alkalitolerans]
MTSSQCAGTASQRLRIGLRVPPCRPIPDLVAFTHAVRDSGIDDVWFPDSQLLWRDVFAVSAAVLRETADLGVGTAVTNLVTRHPSVVASAARTVHEIDPGRFVLGVGVGNSSVGPVGLRPSTNAALRDGLGTVRALLAGQDVAFGGVSARLRDAGNPVPLYIAASGPRNLRLAGEIADGAILLSGVAPTLLADSTARIQEGGALANRERSVPVTVSAFCRVTDDVERDARELKPLCASIARNGGAAALAAAGVHVQESEPIPDVYPDLVHAEDWEHAVRACDSYVSDAAAVAFARTFCLYGTGAEIATRLEEIRLNGASAVLLQHVGSYDLPERLLADVPSAVLTQSSTK